MQTLYATDGSETAEAALRMLEALGSRQTVDVTVLATSAVKQQGPAEALLLPPEVLPHIRRHWERVVAGAAERLAQAGFRVRSEIEEGDPGSRIVEMVASAGYDLVIVGAGRHTWLGGMLLGSTSMHVLHTAASSVMVVHRMRRRADPVGILVASDGSDSAVAAAATFRRFADPARCAMTILSVAEIPTEPPEAVPYPAIPSEATREVAGSLLYGARKAADYARSVAEAEAALFRSDGFHVEEVRALEGAPRRVILEECEREGHDLVVVGSRGLSPVGRMVLGSVSDAVARHARATFVGRFPEPAAGRA